MKRPAQSTWSVSVDHFSVGAAVGGLEGCAGQLPAVVVEIAGCGHAPGTCGCLIVQPVGARK